MTFQEKRSLGLLLSNIAVPAIYYSIIYNRFQAGDLGALGDTRMWAAIILLSIPIYIAANILMMILVNIVQAIATREEPRDIVDEMDKLIELKATRNFYHTFMAGFLLALGSQYLRMEIHIMFIILIVTIIISSLISELSQLYFYKRGV